MKQLLMSVLVAALLAGCSKPTAPTETAAPEATSAPATRAKYPVLVVDELHQMSGSNPPPAYQIAAGAGIRLDATQFHFTYGTNPITPNTVQLVLNHSAYKVSRLVETNLFVIDRTTLEPVRGGAFPGFRSGDRAMCMIGRSVSKPEKEEVWVSWVGQIEVK